MKVRLVGRTHDGLFWRGKEVSSKAVTVSTSNIKVIEITDAVTATGVVAQITFAKSTEFLEIEGYGLRSFAKLWIRFEE